MPDDTEADSVTETTETSTTPATTTTETKTVAEKDWQAEAEKWRRMSREQETRAKANATAAQRLADLEESQKTEAQKVQDRASAAEERATAAERDLFRYKVAVTMALPADLVDRLRGDTEEEMTADAKILLALVKPKPELRPDQSQGSRGGTSAAPDMNALLRSAAGRG